MTCSHPICTRRGGWVRHLKPETQTLQTRNGWVQTRSIPQNVIIHHLIILISLGPSVHLSVETSTHNTTITSQTRTLEHIRTDCNLTQHFFCVSVCVFVLTELALLGLGHGRPVPGPLEDRTNENLSWIMHLSGETFERTHLEIPEKKAHMLTPGIPGPMVLCGGLIPPPKFWEDTKEKSSNLRI